MTTPKYCPKTGRQLEDNTVEVNGRKLACCDLITCPNWGRLCECWQDAMDAAEPLNECGDTCGDICCADLEPDDDLACGCEKE